MRCNCSAIMRIHIEHNGLITTDALNVFKAVEEAAGKLNVLKVQKKKRKRKRI